MFANNPYAQAGWYNPQNPHSINGSSWTPNASLPPTFGALPPPEPAQASVVRFEFNNFQPDIFNCMVIGPNQRKYFEVKTNTAGTTVISKPGEVMGIIQWQRHPQVEIRGVIASQQTAQFLRLSTDQSYRTMTIAGRQYVWVPRGSGIYLYSAGPNPPAQFARLSLAKDNSRVHLDITSEAFQAGLFEPSIVSTILLFSAKNID